MSLANYVGKWATVFDIDILNSILIKLEPVYKSKVVCPPQSNVFNAFHFCNYDDCKVVFLGQDPYPQKGVATGILFANKEDKSPVSPSLQVVRKASLSSQGGEDAEGFDQTLLKWCNQGCLLLNSSLTVECGKPQSHALLWRPFISSFLKKYSNAEPGIVYVLMGNDAKSFKPYINNDTNIVIETLHPAYYARKDEDMPPEIFAYINRLMIGKYGIPIKW